MNKDFSGDRNFLLAGRRLYPYLKITDEKFPRLLVTRRIENDSAEYFGAFLPETGVRFFLDFLNKTFKLRTCTIDVDGRFDVPCPQFYARRCLAPCVENLCEKREYDEAVELVRHFLKRENAALRETLVEKIETCADRLDFETASRWRDKFGAVENFRRKNEGMLWLDEATDNWEIDRQTAGIFLYLVTVRGRKALGRRVFVFDERDLSDAEILERILPEFYRFHAPAEIRVAADFPARKNLAAALSERENRKVKITVINEYNQRKTIDRAIQRNKHEFDLKNIKPPVSLNDLQKQLRRIFALKQTPKRIEAFDVAHISGAHPAGANAVWENGKFAAEEYGFWFFDAASELEALKNSVSARFSNDKIRPDLVLIDGGSAQLRAALKALEGFENRKFPVISAVKPAGKHGEISHFLLETGEKIIFDPGSHAFRFLQNLRDEAHAAANSIHRISRDFSLFYELASVLPGIEEKTRREILRKYGSINNLKNVSLENLKADFDSPTAARVRNDLQNFKTGRARKITPPIVPIRYDDPNGDALNLQPLRSIKE